MVLCHHKDGYIASFWILLACWSICSLCLHSMSTPFMLVKQLRRQTNPHAKKENQQTEGCISVLHKHLWYNLLIQIGFLLLSDERQRINEGLITLVAIIFLADKFSIWRCCVGVWIKLRCWFWGASSYIVLSVRFIYSCHCHWFCFFAEFSLNACKQAVVLFISQVSCLVYPLLIYASILTPVS